MKTRILIPLMLAVPTAASPQGLADPAGGPGAVNDSILRYEFEVPRLDGSAIRALVRRPRSLEPVPIVLVIAGSTCLASELGSWLSAVQPPQPDQPAYALMFVEKPGAIAPQPDAGEIRYGPETGCPDEFYDYYDLETRILDHLRVVQHLRAHAPWWNGDLRLWGFSDGGTIGVSVAAFTPEVRRVVLGGFGGGMPQREELLQAICSSSPDQGGCAAELNAQFAAMREARDRRRTWLGFDNSWRVWATRIDAVATNLLSDFRVPVLVYHGTEDGSVPVASARRLRDDLAEAPVPLTYREIEGMGHSLGAGLDPGAAEALRRDVLRWLLQE